VILKYWLIRLKKKDGFKKFNMSIKNTFKKYILAIILLFSILLNILLLFNVTHGLWLFFCLTLWILIVFFIWAIAYIKFNIKKKFKNPYTLLLINSLFILFITTAGTRKAPWFNYLWLFFQAFIVVFSFLIWFDFQIELKKKDGRSVFKKWLSGKRLKILQLFMVFFILIQAFVTFPYAFEPILRWKSEQNKEAIQNTVDVLLKNCDTDEEKTVILLNWFERHSGNMFNNWGIPTLHTGLIRSMCLSFGNGHEHFYLFCNFYIRPRNRDYPSWVFTTRSGRCEEFSILFREMAHAAGLEVRSIIGKEFDHLWAEVKIEGKWITVDPSNVVHNRILEDSEFTGYNLSRKRFVKRFTNNDVAFIFAEYHNGTRVPVTDRYIDNLSTVNITVVDENNLPMGDTEVEISSGTECSFITNENGKCQIQLGKGTITFRSRTDGFIFLSGEETRIIDENEFIDIIITLRSDYTNVMIVIVVIIIFSILIILHFLKRKNRAFTNIKIKP
jgi:hypothetical protein